MVDASSRAAAEVTEEESPAMLPLASLDLHRIQLGRIVTDEIRRAAVVDWHAHRISLLSEPFQRGVLDEHTHEVLDRSRLQLAELLIHDLMDAFRRKGRESCCEPALDLPDPVVLLRRTHGRIVQRLPAGGNPGPPSRKSTVREPLQVPWPARS